MKFVAPCEAVVVGLGMAGNRGSTASATTSPAQSRTAAWKACTGLGTKTSLEEEEEEEEEGLVVGASLSGM